MPNFKLGRAYPREGFVQGAIEAYFCEPEHEPIELNQVDLVSRNRASGETWIIEAKGETADVGLDFRTGLGQLIQAMGDPNARYGLAVPGTVKFKAQMAKVPERIRERLGIHWIVVDESGGVTIVPPGGSHTGARQD